MNILHIPSWYPNINNSINGIFIKNQIEAISDYDSNTHIVLVWHNTMTYSLKNPIKFIYNYFLSYKKFTIQKEGNINYIKFTYFLSYYKFFGNNEKRLQRKIKKIISTLHNKYVIDLIHSHITYPGGYIAKHMKDHFKIQYIISEHMGPFPFEIFKEDIKNKIINPILNADKVIAVSNFQAKEINSYTKINPAIIANVIDEREFSICEKEINHEPFVFLLVGSLSHIKGVDLLIEAIKLLNDKKIENFKVKIIGNGKILDDLKQLSLDLKTKDNIIWLGELNRKKIIDNFKNSHCFISTSRHESFGIAIVEALACGKPVIATRSGGPEDTINKFNGLLVERENPLQIAQAMEWMIGNISSFNSLEIRRDYEKKYSREVIAQKYLDIYKQIKKK